MRQVADLYKVSIIGMILIKSSAFVEDIYGILDDSTCTVASNYRLCRVHPLTFLVREEDLLQ